MGATEFSTTAKGTTAEIAFRNAVKDAQYDRGHGGYTGTIAEKRSFTMINVATEAPKAIAHLEAERDRQTVSAMKKLAKRRAELVAKGYAAMTRAESDELDRMPIIELDASRLAARRANLTKEIREAKTKRGAPRAVAHYLMDVRDSRVDDKWGPAACVQLSAREFLFFGVASC